MDKRDQWQVHQHDALTPQKPFFLIKADGHEQDTIVFYIPADNGASAEGGFEGRDKVNIDGKSPELSQRLERIEYLGGEAFQNHYATAWAWALNSPFQWAKEVASHFGGTIH